MSRQLPVISPQVAIIAAGATIVALSFGVRSTFGVVLDPMSSEFGWPREIFSLSMAVQNLVWGLAQPFFGTIAVVVYPIIGRFFHMPDPLFGLWSGVAINDTSQVIAASGIYSEAAQNVATVTKLTRNLFMAPVILILGFIYARRNAAEASSKVN